MVTQRIAATGALVIMAIAWPLGAWAGEDKIETWKRETWQMQLGLAAPNLAPAAVQWAVVDEDPAPGFTARVTRMRGFYQSQIEQAKDESQKKIARSSEMTVSWDLGFKTVTGDRIYLLTSTGSHGFSSNGPDGKKWIVTKVVRIKGKPVCWCLPVEVKKGEQITVTLSEDNLFDLESPFDAAMQEPGKTAQPAPAAKGSAAAAAQPAAEKPAAEKAGVPGEPLPLNIAPFYNMPDSQTSIVESFLGRQVVDGLPFQAGGQARLWGQTVAERNPKKPLPETFKGICIGRMFDELHLVHHTMWPDVEGRAVAYISLNYADGTEFIFSIRYGGQVRDWYFLPSYDKDLPTDPNTKICWRRPPVQFKAPVRLFKSKLVNPFPQKVVATMDVVSAHNLASYMLLAATVANRDPSRPITPPVPAAEPPRKFDGKVAVQVVDDATGKAIEGALVEPSVDVLEEWLVGAPFYTSAAGKGTIRYPIKQTSRIAASVKKEGYLPQWEDWDSKIPKTFTFRLRPAERMENP